MGCTGAVVVYLDDLGVCAAAVAGGGVHPGALRRRALLFQGALLVVDAPATLEPGVGLQTHATAVPQGVALIQMSWGTRGML